MRMFAAALGVLLAVPLCVGAGEGEERPLRTFEGMHREALAVLLGPPHKEKRSKGRVTLVYKLKRVTDDYLPGANERLLVVPGHGPCISVTGNEDGFDESVSIEPTRTDREGRPVSGGVTRSRSKTVDLSDGERFGPPPETPGKVVGKLKLTLVLDGDHVESWTAAP